MNRPSTCGHSMSSAIVDAITCVRSRALSPEPSSTRRLRKAGLAARTSASLATSAEIRAARAGSTRGPAAHAGSSDGDPYWLPWSSRPCRVTTSPARAARRRAALHPQGVGAPGLAVLDQVRAGAVVDVEPVELAPDRRGLGVAAMLACVELLAPVRRCDHLESELLAVDRALVDLVDDAVRGRHDVDQVADRPEQLALVVPARRGLLPRRREQLAIRVVVAPVARDESGAGEPADRDRRRLLLVVV